MIAGLSPSGDGPAILFTGYYQADIAMRSIF